MQVNGKVRAHVVVAAGADAATVEAAALADAKVAAVLGGGRPSGSSSCPAASSTSWSEAVLRAASAGASACS